MTATEELAKIEQAWDWLINQYDTDVFMEPCMESMDYVSVEMSDGSTEYIPWIDFDWGYIPDGAKMTKHECGYLAWTTAPGYLDRTDYTPIDSVGDLESWFDSYFEPLEEESE
jgi:hypothetical protein